MPKEKKAKVSKPKKVTKKVAKKVGDVRFEVLVNDTHFKTDANSLPEAIAEFINSPLFPIGAIKTKVIIRLGIGDDVTQKIWQSAEARRIFSNLSIKPDLIALFSEKISRRF
jgi:hypothetical protein